MTKRFSTLKLDNYKPLRDLVFSAIRESILNGTLEPGERLMEVQLAEEMGVSEPLFKLYENRAGRFSCDGAA